MTTWVPIYTCVAEKDECIWRLSRATEEELAEAIKILLLVGVVDEKSKRDFEWLVANIANNAEKLCKVTESQWFCIVSSKLKELVDQLYKLHTGKHDGRL